MAVLVSPGVSVSVIDQSINVGAGPGTVPLIFIATQQDKLDPTSSGVVAPGTTKANAGQVWSITSQRDLVSTFGDPVFYSVSGTSLNGYPLNEYGLLAAYSYLGISNLCRVVRADVDTAQLEATPIEPTSPAAIGTYWFDQSSSGSSYGLFTRSGRSPNETWAAVTPNFVYDFATGTNNTPSSADGVDGNHAVVFQTALGTLSYWVMVNSEWSQIGATAYTSTATASSSGNIVTVDSTDGLAAGMVPTVSAGTGAFALNTVITEVTSSTTFTVSAIPSVPLTGGSITFAGGIATLGTLTPGGSYLPNIYENVPLTGGTGTGARATININSATNVGGVINDPAVLITSPGTGYTAGDHLSASDADLGGAGGSGFDIVVDSVSNAIVASGPIATFGAIVATSGPGYTGLNYLPGTYTSVPLVGGHGVGATADIIVNGATNVTTITLVAAGTGYVVGDQLSALPADLGVLSNPAGSGLQAGGFVVPVLSISTGSGSSAVVTAGFDMTIQSIWPNLAVASTVQEYWVKTSSAAQGANLVLRKMEASVGAFVQVEAPVLVNDAAADAYYSSNAAGSAGQIYIMPVAEGAARSLEFRMNTSGAWAPLTNVVGSATVPARGPTNGQLWFNGEVGVNGAGESTVDILIADGAGSWQNANLEGFTFVDAAPTAGDPTVFSQSGDPQDNVPAPSLVINDIWVDTDVSPYPVIHYWNGSAWVLVDNADQTTNHGILFQDARSNPLYTQGGAGENNGGDGNPDLDPDAPDADLYPKGFMLWNTRYSTNNVKVWQSPYVFNDVTASADNTHSSSTGRWSSTSGNNPGGAPYMGTAAQQIVIVRAIQSAVISNEDIRAEDLYFNLIAAPGFVEAIDEMLVLNDDRKDTAFIVGDTPFTLAATGTSLQNWATDHANAFGNGADGLVSASKYFSAWYPSGLSTNVDGTDVVVPPSHMALRTIAYNDQVAYPWFAPAGLQRGIVNNAAAVGYVNAQGQFVTVKLNEGQRDILYQNGINPIRVMPQGGIVIFGQKTRQPYASATDRINVVRLENYLRYQLNMLAQPFLFEPNDTTTRKAVLDAFNRFLSELITLRGLYDFLVVCDLSNNTPARIDRNELWIDIAIQPVKAIEFIYIPIRIKNTGASLTTP